ncbi:hypothetical protein O6H91_13G081700 [Diphasiastrum complanatum]|uniref:Uncharacterized protein n=1 Tax=Diphasiastrum complanatum TaxID=34168 RepID=A0ACC2BX41_DIPCM|nr:hypothetical protein O6H91_13G081700 [Diphasiastrum complanatum]
MQAPGEDAVSMAEEQEKGLADAMALVHHHAFFLHRALVNPILSLSIYLSLFFAALLNLFDRHAVHTPTFLIALQRNYNNFKHFWVFWLGLRHLPVLTTLA